MSRVELDEWAMAPRLLSLPENEIHVWRAGLDGTAVSAVAVLSDEERTRAAAFHFESDRRRFVASRITLRGLLARYLGAAAGELRFVKGRAGKPRLAHPASGLKFNLSHSGELMLVAVARDREVGVDVEMVRENIPVQMLADHHFEPAAAAALRALSEARRVQNFYEIWTRTEAQLKAGGRGLSDGTRVRDAARWAVQPLFPGAGYAAALAVEAGDLQLRCYSWTA